MYRHIPRLVFTMIVGLAAAAGDSLYAQTQTTALMWQDVQPEFPKIIRQPEDQAIRLGSNVTFTVNADSGDSYLWMRNGVEIPGETNAALTLKNVKPEDVGLYACYVIKGGEAVPTRAANLNVYAALGGGGGAITVYGLPIPAGGSQGSCPGAYVGFVSYTKPIVLGWGWAPTVGTTVHTATDLNRTDTKVQYFGKFGDCDCDQTSVTVPDPAPSPKYRFAVFFTNNVPIGPYAITLDGFDP